MKTLSSQGLIDAYISSIDLQLDKEFIQILLLEIKRRQISIDNLITHNFESENSGWL
jgi:hypothetical protein